MRKLMVMLSATVAAASMLLIGVDGVRADPASKDASKIAKPKDKAVGGGSGAGKVTIQKGTGTSKQ